jgi:hypothetical protein
MQRTLRSRHADFLRTSLYAPTSFTPTAYFQIKPLVQIAAEEQQEAASTSSMAETPNRTRRLFFDALSNHIRGFYEFHRVCCLGLMFDPSQTVVAKRADNHRNFVRVWQLRERKEQLRREKEEKDRLRALKVWARVSALTRQSHDSETYYQLLAEAKDARVFQFLEQTNS